LHPFFNCRYIGEVYQFFSKFPILRDMSGYGVIQVICCDSDLRDGAPKAKAIHWKLWKL
jgi:hypothetical protein